MNIKNMKIAHKLGLCFCAVIGLMLVLASFSFFHVNQLSGDIEVLTKDRYAKIVMTHKIKDALNETARNMRNVLLMSDPAAIEKEFANIEKDSATISASIASLDKMIIATKGRELFKLTIIEREKFLPLRNGFLALVKAGQKEQALEMLLSQVRPAQIAYMDSLEKLIEFQSELMKKTAEETESEAVNTKRMILLLSVLAVVVSILLAYFAARAITRPLHEAVAIARRVADGDLSSDIIVNSKDETGKLLQALFDMNQSLLKIVTNVRTGTDTIANASSEIANGNMDLSSRTEEQASSLEETAASLEEITSTVKQNSDNARQAQQLAKTATDTAIKGGQVVDGVVHTMGSISAASEKIVDIISVIDSIAFQTNILALNAAVEAARAGEQGRGFAVVASEVRNLAHRSATAAKEIKVLINDTVGTIGTCSKQVQLAGTSMEDILVSVRHVTDIMEEISAASSEQEQGIEQINQAVSNIDTVTQQNAALVEEAAAAASTMQDQASQLAQLVSFFKLNADVLQRLHASTTPGESIRYDVKHANLNRKIALDKPIKTSKVKALTGGPAKRFEVARGKTAEWVEF